LTIQEEKQIISQKNKVKPIFDKNFDKPKNIEIIEKFFDSKNLKNDKKEDFKIGGWIKKENKKSPTKKTPISVLIKQQKDFLNNIQKIKLEEISQKNEPLLKIIIKKKKI